METMDGPSMSRSNPLLCSLHSHFFPLLRKGQLLAVCRAVRFVVGLRSRLLVITVIAR